MTPLPEPLSPYDEKKLRAAWALIGAWEEREDGPYQCPLCHGEGEADGFVLDATNVCPATIAGYGIGEGLAAAELVAESTGALLSTLDAVREERDVARGESERLRKELRRVLPLAEALAFEEALELDSRGSVFASPEAERAAADHKAGVEQMQSVIDSARAALEPKHG